MLSIRKTGWLWLMWLVVPGLSALGCGAEEDLVPESRHGYDRQDAVALACPPTSAPQALAPSGTIGDPRPTFQWTAVPGATSYTLYVLRVADEAIVLRQTDLTGTTYRPASALPVGVQLRWKIKGESPCGPGPYSPSIYFVVSNVAPPCPPNQAPVPGGPSGTITDPTPTFSWQGVPGASSYTLYVLRVADEAVLLRQTDITGLSHTPAGSLPPGVEMRWKVKGESSCGPGPYSPSVYFRIEGAPAKIDFGYYRADTIRFGNLVSEVRGHTNLMYIGGTDAGFSETPPAERRANLTAIIDRAAAAGMSIMLDIELGGPLTVGDVLLAARARWDAVKYVILGDELQLPVADANAEIAALRQRLANLGLDTSKPVGVTLTPDTTLSHEIVYANWDFINIEAYTQPCSCQACGAATAAAEIQAVASRVAAMKARIPAATWLTVVMQGYDRNGAFTNIPVLAALNRATYFDMVRGDPRVRAIVIFAYAREGNQCPTGPGYGFGTRGHPELLAVHQEIWADIVGP